MEILISNMQEKITIIAAVENIITAVLEKAAEKFAIDPACEVSVVLTDDDNIRELNRQYRNQDCSTDVLSFAMNEGDEPEITDGPANVMLGDIVISLETAIRQAADYGHSQEREVAYLTIHGMLHLLGYDHENEEARSLMREQEEAILSCLGINRLQ